MLTGILLAMGLLPLLLGLLLNRCMMTLATVTPVFLGAAVLLLVLWAAVSFWAVRSGAGAGKVLLFQHLLPLLDLAFVGFQNLVLGSYLPNAPGIWSQLYYLPLMDLGFRLTRGKVSMVLAYGACFLLLAAASLAGCCLGKKRGGPHV